MNINRNILALTLLLTAVSACTKSKLEQTYNGQEAKIDSYIKSKQLIKHDSSWVDTLGFELDSIAAGEDSIKIDTVWNTVKTDTTWTDTLRAVRHGGGNRLILKEGTGEELKSNGYVSFYYAGYTFSGTFNQANIFVTNHQKTAEQSGWELTDADNDIYEIQLSEAKLVTGLKDGLHGVRAGEECEIIFTGKYGFGDESFGIIPANSALLYKIWVVGVAND